MTTFEECKECKNHWFNGIGIEMCDKDWNCLEHEELHLTRDANARIDALEKK